MKFRNFLNIFAPPKIEDADSTILAKVLNSFLWFGIIVTLVVIILALLLEDDPFPRITLSICYVILFVIAITILHRNQLILSAKIFVYCMGALLTMAIFLFDGLQGISFSGYIIIILVASLILSWRDGIIVLGMSIGTGIVVIFADLINLSPLPSGYTHPILLWIMQSFIFLWIMYLVYLTQRSLRDTVRRTRESEQELRQSQERQKLTQTTLEVHARDLERRIVQLQVAAEIARDAAMLLDSSILLDRVVNLIRERFGFYHAGIFMVDDNREYAILKAATGETGSLLVNRGHRLKIGSEGIVGYVTSTGEPRIAMDVIQDLAYFQNPLLTLTRSELCLPLKSGERIIGALDVQSLEQYAFDKQDISVFQTMADQLVVALETARLFEATKRQIEELTILHAVAVASTEFLSEDILIEQITNLIASSIYPDNFGILLSDDNNQMLTYHYSYQERITVVHNPIPFGTGIVGQVALTGLPRNIPDTTSESDYARVDDAIRSELCVPVRTKEKTIGVINAESVHHNNFSQDDERLLFTIANQMATAIMRIRSYEAERRRVNELELLRQATLHLTSSLDLHTTLETLLEFALELIHADIGYFFLYEEEIISFGAVKWLGNEPEQIYYIEPRQNGLTYAVARSGKRHIISDANTNPFYQDHPWNGAIAGLPLRRGNTILGVLNLTFQGKTHDFNENELRILELLADEAVIAITNAKLYAESQEKARALEEALGQQQELDRLKTEFIQNVTHELRNPLAVAQSYSNLLISSDLSSLKEDQLEAVTLLTNRIDTLVKIVDDFTIILQARAHDSKMEMVNLVEIGKLAIFETKSAIEFADLELINNFPDHPIWIMGKPSHLNRVIVNLINNAIKFSPQGGKIKIKIQQQAVYGIIEVEDLGIGIAPEHLDRIFERFYQVDGSTKRRYGGTGLGLALVKEITEAHGGIVTVNSEIGKGSIFTVMLPALMLQSP